MNDTRPKRSNLLPVILGSVPASPSVKSFRKLVDEAFHLSHHSYKQARSVWSLYPCERWLDSHSTPSKSPSVKDRFVQIEHTEYWVSETSHSVDIPKVEALHRVKSIPIFPVLHRFRLWILLMICSNIRLTDPIMRGAPCPKLILSVSWLGLLS